MSTKPHRDAKITFWTGAVCLYFGVILLVLGALNGALLPTTAGGVMVCLGAGGMLETQHEVF